MGLEVAVTKKQTAAPGVVVLLTDFGLEDHYVGVLHAIVAAEAPELQRIDLTHAVPPGDVWTACHLLRCALPHLPERAVVLAVVDPGVGSDRRAVAVAVGERWLVAPDNGLAAATGPVGEGLVLDASHMGLPEPSAVFQGRDLFAPAAARLARGDDPVSLGVPFDAGSLVVCPLPDPERGSGMIRGTVLHVDRFGNLISNIPAHWVPEGAVVRSGWARVTRRVRCYEEGGEQEPIILAGSSGLLEIAVAKDSAARMLDLGLGDPIEVLLRSAEAG